MLKVAAAAELLSSHHSAQRPMGGRGGGGARGGGKGAQTGGPHYGGVGNGRLAGRAAPPASGDVGQLLQELQHQSQQQQRILQALCGSGNLAQSAGRGSGGGGAQSAQRRQSQSQPRDGDWACTGCSFYPNFARRRRCLQCGRERAVPPASRGATLTAGPVGPGGLRPQLAWGAARLGASDAPPTHRVPGSSAAAPPPRSPGAPRPVAPSYAAAAAGATRGGIGTTGNGGRGVGQAQHMGRAAGPPQDEEGFTEVARNASRRRRGREEEEGEGHILGDSRERDGPPSVTLGQVGGGGSAEMGPGADEGTSDMAGDEDEHEHGVDHLQNTEDDPVVLRTKLEEEQATVRALAREGIDAAHPAMVAAVAARDAAEDAWRAARTPHPVARRMGWAQQALDRAMRSRDKVRDELAEFDAHTKEQRGLIEERLGQAMERVSKRRETLEALQEEAALDAPGYRKGKGTAEVCSQLAGGMRQSIAPRVAALASKLADGSEAQEQFNLLVAQLEGLQGRLDQHANDGDRGYEQYDIADEPSEAEWSESHDLPSTGARSRETGGTEPRGHVGPPRWRSEGYGRWGKGGDSSTRRTGKGTGQGDAVAAATAPSAMDTGATQGPSVTAGASAAQTRIGAGGNGRGRAGGDDESAPPPSKLHKSQETSASNDVRATDDNSRALELMQAQQGAAAAGEFGSQAAIQAAAQLHSRNVDRIARAAINQGVQPLTDTGDELIVLSPQELAQWAEAKLDRAEDQWW